MVNYNEFLNASIDHSEILTNEDHIKFVFDILDKNGDGKIDLIDF